MRTILATAAPLILASTTTASTLSLRPNQPTAQPAEPQTTAPQSAQTDLSLAPTTSAFGDQGSTWISIQSGLGTTAGNFDANARLRLSKFIADDFELSGSLGTWGHFQDDADNEASLELNFGFRYHFINNTRDAVEQGCLRGATVYADLGIGILYATGDVPPDGTRYNFTPRAGLGMTLPISDGPTRLDLGLRWQHFSNGSSSGSDDNPARDQAMIYAGITWPF